MMTEERQSDKPYELVTLLGMWKAALNIPSALL